MKFPIAHEETGLGGIFYIDQDGERLAELTYRRTDKSQVVINHTQVDASLGGQGVGRSLLDAAVHWARESNTKVSSTCSYATAQFAKDPSIRDVLA